ncbi:MAG: NAD(P)/FAD-dependent oxidoreductase [Alphaproteobacteria bacterium]|nr:NAD(P)/FAD-dependent oxidoreductase [Alphaproteobacteria bacterium]
MKKYDIIIIGAGASGMFSAISATKRARRVAILDMGTFPLRKVNASGGGRCNLTNTAAARTRYFGENPDFVRSALAQFSPYNMLVWTQQHNIQTVQKTPGQYFCADGASIITDALRNDAHHADLYTRTTVTGIKKDNDTFSIITDKGIFVAESVIIATGGTSFASLGVSDIGYKIAKEFGHKIIPVRPALCAIATDIFSSALAGTSMPVEITVAGEHFTDSILFTHFGVGGPATYRASVRDISNGIHINLMPGVNVFDILRVAKQINGRRILANVLSEHMPNRVARWIAGDDTKNIADYKDTELKQIATQISDIFIPRDKIKLHTLQSAEVVRGGVATDAISSKTMESKLCRGLFFVGEVLDIAGDLGGFNLHWAWASGYVAGQNA